MNTTNKTHNFSIDFIKGVAACSVVFLHNMPNYYIGSFFWIGQAVPIFLFITAYLTYGSSTMGRNIDYYSPKSILKMVNKIFKPFLFMTIIQCVILYKLSPSFSIKSVLTLGGIGPGSYYPWLYLQAWIVLPIIIFVVDKIKVKYSFLLFLIVCVILEILSNPQIIPSPVYRLLFTRYLFLLYLACITRKLNLKINICIVILSIFSLIYLAIVTYFPVNLEPFIYNTGWVGQTYPAFFYTVLVFLSLVILYNKYSESFFSKLFVKFGNWSYELFLWQMFVFSFISIERFSFCGKYKTIFFVLVTSILCFIPLYIYKEYLKQKIKLF